MGWEANTKAMAPGERRQQREAKNRQRELDRQAKEMAKLSALEQSRLEVETYENTLEVLLSVHKEQADSCDWLALVVSLPPVSPRRQLHNEMKARQRLAVAPGHEKATDVVQRAQQQDEREYQEALQTHNLQCTEQEKLSALARRVLTGEHGAYIEAIHELNPFAELAGIGSSLHFTVHSAHILECVLGTNGRRAIPAEVKTLTATGKVSAKAMPKLRFIEIYQDYICSCVLRVARELFALLPIKALIISASAETLDTSTGQMVERPFLSVVIDRENIRALNFERLDPSDAIMGLPHRGELKAARKTGDFEFVIPLTVDDLPKEETNESPDVAGLLAAVKRLHAELTATIAALLPKSVEDLSTTGEL